jgi:hypothetical protein
MKGAVVQMGGGSKGDMQTQICPHSHKHTKGHPGGLKDRNCWTHLHEDKGRGRLSCTVEL